jgi:aminoglycoside 6'-N-acetyltransferase
VARWWREPPDLAAVEAEYGPMIDGSDLTEGFVAVAEGLPFGFLQRYRLDENPDWQRAVSQALADAGDEVIGASAGIDYLIGDQTMTGRGWGRRMIAEFVDLAWERYPDITAVVVAVDQGNEPSWRALEGAAFHRVWAGLLDSDDPSDEGPSYLYVRRRPGE